MFYDTPLDLSISIYLSLSPTLSLIPHSLSINLSLLAFPLQPTFLFSHNNIKSLKMKLICSISLLIYLSVISPLSLFSALSLSLSLSLIPSL